MLSYANKSWSFMMLVSLLHFSHRMISVSNRIVLSADGVL